jgi:hypothetical protein
VTGETLARWCPNCTGTQYAFDLPPQTSNPARESGVAAWLGGLGAVCFALLLASLVVTGWSITSGMLFFICGGVAGLVRVEHDTRPTMDS